MHFLHNYRCISNKITRKISCYLCFCLISPIQTLLSALESHQINCCQLAGYTAGGELHPAPKSVIIIFPKMFFVNNKLLLFLKCDIAGLQPSGM